MSKIKYFLTNKTFQISIKPSINKSLFPKDHQHKHKQNCLNLKYHNSKDHILCPSNPHTTKFVFKIKHQRLLTNNPNPNNNPNLKPKHNYNHHLQLTKNSHTSQLNKFIITKIGDMIVWIGGINAIIEYLFLVLSHLAHLYLLTLFNIIGYH